VKKLRRYHEKFWEIRAANYDKLFWVRDNSYIEELIRLAEFDKGDIVLDVGSGTGAVAKAIQPYVNHTVAIDISDAMLSKGQWEGISVVKWDISDLLFVNNLFNKIIARMVFHHIFDELDRVLVRCYDLLKKSGKIIVAEGVPPTDEEEVVDWYTEMFKLKEERRTFRSNEMALYLKKNGFKDIFQTRHIMKNFSVKNWLENSGIDRKRQQKIMEMHINANEKIKDVYKMRIINNDCIIETKNIITVGRRN